MTHLKTLITLTAFVLLTACGGATATGDPAQTTDCAANPFAASCIAEDIGAPMRLTACLADITINPLCTGDAGIATLFCEANPFDTRTACTADTYLSLRVEDCITAGNAGIARCNTVFTASASNTCLTNPFTDACKADGAFATYADTARTNRVSFCGISGNAGNALCTALTTCQANPFGATCGGVYFESIKKSYCLDSDNHAEGFCVNAADWVDGFATPLYHRAERSNRPSRYEFLRGTAGGLINSDVKIKVRGNILTPDVITLNFETLGGDKKNGVAWFPGGSGAEGEANLGFAAFNRLYAGIFSGTSLGAPLATADVSASVPWEGRIRWYFYNNVVNQLPTLSKVTNFHLTVDFANSEISGFINRTGAAHFLLKAEFDDSGRFAGRITHGIFAGNDKDATPIHATPGTLTGIIGKEGAVGAFISDQDHNFRIGNSSQVTYQAFVGGFVARPPTVAELTERARVEEVRLQKLREEDIARMERERIAQVLLDSQVTYTDWVEVTRPDTARATPLANQFLTGSDATGATSIKNTNLNNATNGGTDFDGDATVGFQLFQGANSVDEGDNPTNFYAGILTTTNLGAPLTEHTADGTWKGYLYAARVDGAGGYEQADFELMVDFDATTISAADIPVTRADGAALADDVATYDFSAMWDGRGVFQSTITRTVAVMDSDDVVSAGLLRGIIGQEGAVGVFISNADAEVNYAGGFVAESPLPTVDYSDWLEITTPDTTRDEAPLVNQFLAGADRSETPTNGHNNLITLGNAAGNAAFNGDDNDGFQVFTNDRSTGADSTNYYAGILTTTNLGASLTQATASGVWEGRLYAARDTVFVRDNTFIGIGNQTTFINTEVADFAPTVDFDTNTISATITGVTDFGGVEIAANTVSYAFSAEWDGRGVFQSTITRTASNVASAGKLTGIIGQGGAVGVFVSNAGVPVGYAGGFVARKTP